ncbi:MAG: DASS family sodium-coupled anion symporter, partial [Acidobacteriota bacterium]
IVLFAITPLLAYILYPPTKKSSEDAPIWAGNELAKLGSITAREILMAVLALGALLSWIFLKDQVQATTVALAAICLMVVFKVVSWDDVIGYKQAWNVLAWFATLVTLADGLNKVGFLAWFAKSISGSMAGLSPTATMVGLVLVFFLSHYMFASVTAHVAAMLPVMLAAAMNVPGLDIRLVSILLCGTLGIMGVITPYGTGPSPIYYGSGYVKGKDFWILGLVFGLVYLGAFLLIGFPWNLARA